jgi:hypothetical protein
MKAWLGTSTSGQKGQTRGPSLTCEEEVRDENKGEDEVLEEDNGWGQDEEEEEEEE